MVFVLFRQSANDAEGDTHDENFISKREELKMIYLRSFLNKIDKFFQDKDTVSRKLQ